MEEYLCARVERKPTSSEPCELLCRQDCIVTPFSDWSPCDETCHVTNRTRTRRIVVPPRHRGDHCPEFSEMQACDNCSQSFTYKLGEWGPCSLIGNTYREVKVHHIIGHRSREITCLQSKGILTTLRNCRDKIPDALLFKHQACIIPQDCKVSTWSSLRPHNTSCLGPDGAVVPGFMKKTREVLQLPMGDGLACPPNLVELVQLHGQDPSALKPCKTAKWILSSWSVCSSVPGYSHCGTGIQSRRAICVATGEDRLEQPVEESLCPQPKPLVAQACQTECNWDCSVSQWSSWSACHNGACSADSYDYMIRRRRKRVEGQVGKRHRTREILTLPGPGGKGCPHLSETQACEPQPCFSWQLSFGPCEATPRGGCGQGTRQRFAECVNREGMKVKARFCWEHQTDNRPWEECYVPCPDDCVLSEWGDWSRCPDPCQPDNPGPAIRVRTRRILAYSGSGSQNIPCPNPSSLRETKQCSAPLECAIFQWRTSPWGLCSVLDPGTKCGRGTQRREVVCYSSKELRVIDARCEEKVKPSAVKDCMVPCPVDCNVTAWSEWSHCGTSCRAFTARQLLPKQRRERFIVRYPQNGGLSCPHILSEERQCLNLPVCETYYWDISDWSECILPPIVPLCGDGLRARNVTCRHSNNTEYGLNVCLDQLSSLPALVEPCYVACPTECQLSEWEPWGRCVQGCEGKRFRWRRLKGESKTNPDCRNQNKYPLDEQKECVCDSLRPVVIGSWSDCILKPSEEVGAKFAQMSLKSLQSRTLNDTQQSEVPDQAYCGKGVRYKAISCQTSARDMEGAASCSPTEYQEEDCYLPCPVDCKLSPWTPWSSCSVTCGSGIQQRFRNIQTLPENGGRKCPPLYGYNKEAQSRVCTATCQHHQWQTEDWGPCLPHGESACGPGTQTRNVGCYAVSDNAVSLTLVDSSFCPRRGKPDNVQDCSLPCPGDCVVAHWTDWTPCRQPCNGQQTQTRSRSILRYGGQYSTADCAPALQDVKVCLKGDNCFEYSWELSDWTSCLINDGSEVCGVGHKERYAMCRDDVGQRVDDFKCTELFGAMTEPLVVSCEIPCDNDCLLSEWSDWSMCSETCGLGQTTRYRTTVQAPVGNGRKCPENLQESRPCFKQGCYHWLVTEWSACHTQKGVCGSGVQVRNVSCVGQDGLPANSSRCPHDTEKLVLKTRRSCHMPCPGECRLSQWSEWSKCFISCQDFEQGFRTGVRARSRAILAHPSQDNRPCSDSLWEEDSCQTQQCMHFHWAAPPWGSRLSRTVVCQRSDGLVVEGGCPEEERPASILSCDPPCRVVGSACLDTDTCDCLGLLVPFYAPNGTLVACSMNVTSTTPVSTTDVQPASVTSPWMYAVIAVGTVFVISVAAALYNMCELFRTGPRPRRKAGTKGDGASDTQSGTRTPVAHTDTLTAKNAEMEELYKQCHPQRPPPPPPPASTATNGDPAYQNMDLLDAETSSAHRTGPPLPAEGLDAESGRSRNVGRNSVRLACSPEESQHLLPPPPPPPPPLLHSPYACAGSPSASAFPRPHNRRYPAWQNGGRRARRGSRRLGMLSACFRGGRKVHEEEEEEEEEEEVRFRQKLYLDVCSPQTLPVYSEGDGRGACVEVHTNTGPSSLAAHPNCMLLDSTQPGRKARQKAPAPSNHHPRTTPTPTQHISNPPSREEVELRGNLSSLPVAEDCRVEYRNRGSLSNISELSFDRPLSESSLKLGITAETLRAAMTGMGEEGKGDDSLPLPLPPETSESGEAGRTVPEVSVQDNHLAPDPEGDVLCTDPRVAQLLRAKQDWSLDSGRSTLPPSRNGSLDTPSDSSTWSALNGKRQPPALSPAPRDSQLTFRQSLDNARAARKQANSLPLALPSALHSPMASGPSSLASNSPTLRQHRLGGQRSPSGLSSPGRGSVCDSCRKVLGPADVSYTSDTPDSLSEMSDRSGMETTV